MFWAIIIMLEICDGIFTVYDDSVAKVSNHWIGSTSEEGNEIKVQDTAATFVFREESWIINGTAPPLQTHVVVTIPYNS